MLDWRRVTKQAEHVQSLKEQLLRQEAGDVYPNSLQVVGERVYFLVKEGLDKFLVIASANQGTDEFQGEVSKLGVFTVKLAALDGQNAKVLRSLFPWTAPQAFGTTGISVGFGDRLGLASPGHIKAIAHTNVRPVLAQQSMRELELTDRTYSHVLDAASWAAFQEGYENGFGADGDHLKKIEDVQTALDLGFSMITLDCSEHIDDGVAGLEDSEVLARYATLPEKTRQAYEGLYQNSHYKLQSGALITMGPEHYHRMVLTYYQALDFMEKVYNEVISKVDRPIDFEISIDEVATPTTPQDHFFVAHELKKRGIKASGIAPRFCGYFEKGIDYIGDLAQFESEFAVHADIARHFGYKLSIHSGSDKFSVFPIIGKYAASAGYHVKTAGTNWLEAVRVIAVLDPSLVRKLHRKALESLEAARKYYKVSLDLTRIPHLDTLGDRELPELLNQDDARQLLHITYGFMLRDPQLREEIYTVLKKNENVYDESLIKHMERHLQALGI